MKKLRVGIVGYRGMVGTVLMSRLFEEGDYIDFELSLLSTSQAGSEVNDDRISNPVIQDAKNIETLKSFEVIISCQGGDYTSEIIPGLRGAGWDGYWVDAASTLRMNDDAMIILDPLNDQALRAGIKRGIKNFAGGNCTVSLLLLAIDGLIKANLVEWVSSQTYQAASGAGAAAMQSLIDQMGELKELSHKFHKEKPASSILDIEKKLVRHQKSLVDMPMGAPLAANLIPWIDAELENGQSREEWKALAEANKILNLQGNEMIPIDGTCVRVGAMRCHSQALTIKLRRPVEVTEAEELIASANEWVKLIPNHKEDTVQYLTPLAVSGTLDIVIGRIRKLQIGEEYLGAFTVGDQLLWGAAEPLRRFLRILREENAIL
jgi:aspartate-semialdehyde dehydrogenase